MPAISEKSIPQEVVEMLAKLNRQAEGSVTIVRQGDKITLPKGMSYKEARDWLTRQEKEEETTVMVDETIVGWRCLFEQGVEKEVRDLVSNGKLVPAKAR